MAHAVLDPSRVAAQVVSGIGFIDAERDVVTPETIKSLLGVRKSQVGRLVIRDAGPLQTVSVQLVHVSAHDIQAGAGRLRATSGVLGVEVKRRRAGRLAEA